MSDRVLEFDPDNTQALLINARLLAQKGELPSAVEKAIKTMELEPENIQAGILLSRLHKGDTTQDIFLKMLNARSRMGEEEVKPIVRLLRTRSNNFFSFQPYLGTDRSRVR